MRSARNVRGRGVGVVRWNCTFAETRSRDVSDPLGAGNGAKPSMLRVGSLTSRLLSVRHLGVGGQRRRQTVPSGDAQAAKLTLQHQLCRRAGDLDPASSRDAGRHVRPAEGGDGPPGAITPPTTPFIRFAVSVRRGELDAGRGAESGRSAVRQIGRRPRRRVWISASRKGCQHRFHSASERTRLAALHCPPAPLFRANVSFRMPAISVQTSSTK